MWSLSLNLSCMSFKWDISDYKLVIFIFSNDKILSHLNLDFLKSTEKHNTIVSTVPQQLSGAITLLPTKESRPKEKYTHVYVFVHLYV